MSANLLKKDEYFSKIFEKKKNRILFILFACLSVATMIIIFLFSAQVAEDSRNISNEVGNMVEYLLSVFKWLFSDGLILWIKTHIRKIAHFTAYTLLGGFLLATFLNIKIKKISTKILFSASTGLFYSITDEIHQLFVEGRSGQISDVILDFAGVICGILIAFSIYKIICFLSKKRKKSYKKQKN